MDSQIRPRKVPLPNLDRAAYLERHKKEAEKKTQDNKGEKK